MIHMWLLLKKRQAFSLQLLYLVLGSLKCYHGVRSYSQMIGSLYSQFILYLVKKVPVWFPGASFQRLAQLGRESSTTSRSGPYKDLKRKIVWEHLL